MKRNFIFLEGGLGLGLGPLFTNEGDKVCLLRGSSVPIMLRKYGRHWKAIGECFVHGMMYGELAHLEFLLI
jgi:hypothetical protein